MLKNLAWGRMGEIDFEINDKPDLKKYRKY